MIEKLFCILLCLRKADKRYHTSSKLLSHCFLLFISFLDVRVNKYNFRFILKMIFKIISIFFLILPLSPCLWIFPKHNIHITSCHSNEFNNFHFKCSNNVAETDFFGSTPNVDCEGSPVRKDTVSWISFIECNLTSIPSGLFESYKNVGVFKIGVSGLKTLRESDFNGAIALKRFLAPYNELTNVPASLFIGAPKLEYIDLSHNQISRLTPLSFNGAANVVMLDLSANEISFLPPGIFSNFRTKCILNLQENKIQHIDADIFAGADSIVKMDLSQNKIIDLDPYSFGDLKSLEFLDLSDNPIKRLNGELFAHLLNLKILRITNTKLSTIDFAIFSQMPRLEHLDLSYNKLIEIHFDGSSKLKNFHSLRLFGNRLSSLNGFGQPMVPNLRYLGIAQNHFNCTYLTEFFSGTEWRDSDHKFTHPDLEHLPRIRASFDECYGYSNNESEPESWSVED